MSHHVIHAAITVPLPDDLSQLADATGKLKPLWGPLRDAAEALGGSATCTFTPASAPRSASNGQQPRRRRGRPPRHTTVHTEAPTP